MRRRIATMLAFLALMSAPMHAAPSVWEHTGTLGRAEAERIDDSGMELTVRDGTVTLILSRPTQVKVLTILGQPVSQETLPAGIHRLKLKSRGIYILRVGQATRRITL